MIRLGSANWFGLGSVEAWVLRKTRVSQNSLIFHCGAGVNFGFVFLITICSVSFWAKLLVNNTEMKKCCGNLSHIKNAFTNGDRLEKPRSSQHHLVRGYQMAGMLSVQVDVIAAAHKAMLSGFEPYADKLKDTPAMAAISTLSELYKESETQTAVYLGSDIVAYSVCCIGGSFTRNRDPGYKEVDNELLAKDEWGVYTQRYHDCRIVPKEIFSVKDVLNMCSVLVRINQKVYPKGDFQAAESKKILDNVAGVERFPWRFTKDEVAISKVQSEPRAGRAPPKPRKRPTKDTKLVAKPSKKDSKPAAKPAATHTTNATKKGSSAAGTVLAFSATTKMSKPPKPLSAAYASLPKKKPANKKRATPDQFVKSAAKKSKLSGKEQQQLKKAIAVLRKYQSYEIDEASEKAGGREEVEEHNLVELEGKQCDEESFPLLPPDVYCKNTVQKVLKNTEKGDCLTEPDASPLNKPVFEFLDEGKARGVYRKLMNEDQFQNSRRRFVGGSCHKKLWDGCLVLDPKEDKCDYDITVTGTVKVKRKKVEFVSTIRVRSAEKEGEMLNCLVDLGEAVGSGNARKRCGDISGGMTALGYRSRKKTDQYAPTTKVAKQLRKASKAVGGYMKRMWPELLAKIQEAEKGEIPDRPPNPFMKAEHQPGNTCVISWNLGNSGHIDVLDASECLGIWVCSDYGEIDNWYLVFPDLSVNGSKGVAIKLFHGCAIEWDGRYVRHCSSLIDARDGCVAYGGWFGSCH